jgi:hypothetical protein
MDTVVVTGSVNEKHRLSAEVPDSVPPGPVTILIVPGLPADHLEEAWATGISREWASDLGDPRQDIYTLEDGVPVDAG